MGILFLPEATCRAPEELPQIMCQRGGPIALTHTERLICLCQGTESLRTGLRETGRHTELMTCRAAVFHFPIPSWVVKRKSTDKKEEPQETQDKERKFEKTDGSA